MMGGVINIKSKFGKGTKIKFVVPQKVLDERPIASINNQEQINIGIYIDMEQFSMMEIRDQYSNNIRHMVEQMQVKCHMCRNLSELKRRVEREKFSHVFISMVEYKEDMAYFDELALKTKVIIILNDNDMCIGKTIGGLHKALQNAKNNQVATNIFENLGFDYIGNVDGHDFDSLENALLKAKESNKSVVVHVSTIKGKGYTPSENDKCGFYHGVSAFDISTGVEIKSSNDNTASWSKVYARLLELIMNDNNKSTIIHPATGIGSYLHKVVTKTQ